MTCFYAQPYDISATGFYFETAEEYIDKSARNYNDYGGIIEEYEIQFIDGEPINGRLFEDLGISQCNIDVFIDKIDEWDDHEKTGLILMVGMAGYRFDIRTDNLDLLDNIDIYYVDSLRALAEQFVDEGLYGDIPENLRFYIDYEAIARDLGMEYSEDIVDAQHLVYRCL